MATCFLHRFKLFTDRSHSKTLLTYLRSRIAPVFQTNQDLVLWLKSLAIAPYAAELAEDFLKQRGREGLVSLRAMIDHMVIEEYPDSLNRLYGDAAPDKTGWDGYKHVARFMWSILTHDKDQNGACNWLATEYRDQIIEAYEVYAFFHASYRHLPRM